MPKLKPALGFRRYAIPREGVTGLEVGEVRARVRLANAGDQALVRRGLAQPADVRRFEGDGLVDTGAIRMCLPRALVEEFGLAIVDRWPVEYADGRHEVVDVTEPVSIEILRRETDERALVLGNEILIGQTILEGLDLFVDPINGRVIPNPEHPDYPILMVK